MHTAIDTQRKPARIYSAARSLVMAFLMAIIPASLLAGITVTSPNGGESLMIGSASQVTWRASDVSGEVKVEYTVDGSQWRGIGKTDASAGSIAWKIPNKESRIARVRVSLRKGSATDQSDGVFEIISDPLDATIMLAPNGGEQWTEGEKQNIRWQAPLDAVDIQLDFSTDNGATWRVLAPRNAGTVRVDHPASCRHRNQHGPDQGGGSRTADHC